jgi:3-(3-hydroxy-phenyl)propionate hydroxylase
MRGNGPARRLGNKETAADLIPAISTGLIAQGTQGAGERFIQPVLADGSKLDDVTGDGWRLFAQGAEPVAGVNVVDLATLSDKGAIAAWLAARDAPPCWSAPITMSSAPAAESLIARRAQLLGLTMEKAA